MKTGLILSDLRKQQQSRKITTETPNRPPTTPPAQQKHRVLRKKNTAPLDSRNHVRLLRNETRLDPEHPAMENFFQTTTIFLL
jgi:hypothetical protein